MPSTYAHYCLGRDIKEIAEGKIREIISENTDCFMLGLHGPDLLFYYKPLGRNGINSKGYAMHEQFASRFFSAAKDIYKERGARAEDEAYLLGFLCHFALDSAGHPVVNAQMAEKNLSHTEIETAFDRYLLEKEGRRPLKTDITAHIKNTAKTRAVAAAYFGITEKQAEKAIKSIKFYNKLLSSGNAFTRGFVKTALKITGNSKTMYGCMLPLKIEQKWQDGIGGLERAYKAAVEKAARLIDNYDGYLCDRYALSAELDRDFE